MDQSNNNFKHLPYREGVGIMIINNQKQVFVGRRKDTKSAAWQMPQGGIDPNETPKEAVMRESLEEIGTNNIAILAESANWFIYDVPAHLIPKLWEGKYRGQKQKWFLSKFLGKDSEFNISTEHPEFSAWKWASLQELPKIIVPFKRKLYIAVIKEFQNIIDSIH